MPEAHCQSIRDRLGPYATGDLPPEERAAVEGHLRECAECRSCVERLRAATEALLPLREHLRDQKLDQERRAAVLAQAPGPLPRAMRPRLTLRTQARWAVAAGIAIATVIAGLVLYPDPDVGVARVAAEKERQPPPELGAVPKPEPPPRAEAVADPAAPPSPAEPPAHSPDRPILSEASREEAAPLEQPLLDDAFSERERRQEATGTLGPRAPADFADEQVRPRESRTAYDNAEFAVKERMAQPQPEEAAEEYDAMGASRLEGNAGNGIADVAAAPSPFRAQHVLIGLSLNEGPGGASTTRDTKKPDSLLEESKRSARGVAVAADAPPAESAKARVADEDEGGQRTESAAPQPDPVRVRFNSRVVNAQRQLAPPKRKLRGGVAPHRYHLVYEVELKDASAEKKHGRGDEVNVAVLESSAHPARQQMVNVRALPPVQQSPDETVRAAQANPELFAQACEDELERLAREKAPEEEREERLELVALILRAVADVRPADPHVQSLLKRLAPPASAPAAAAGEIGQ